MKLNFLAASAFITCATGSLMSMNSNTKKAKFLINNDKYIVYGYLLERGENRFSFGPNIVPFNNYAELNDNSYNVFLGGCAEAEQKMVPVKALLQSKERKYRTKIEPLLVDDVSKKHFIVSMKPYESWNIDKL